MLDRASQVLDCLLDASVITVEPGFLVEARTSHGIYGDRDDLALSLEWRDFEGCLWEADFSERALALAELRRGTISLTDTDGTKIVFQLHQPVRRIAMGKSEK